MAQTLWDAVHGLRWFHSIDIGNGLVTPGLTSQHVLQAQADIYFAHGLKGKSFLDVGCWDGFNSFEAHRRGASRVLATDHFAWGSGCWGDRRAFELARHQLAPDLEVLDIDLPELTPERVGRFDVVLFAGVLYHLRNPLLALEQVAQLTTAELVLETHLDAEEYGRPAMVFYPGTELGGDPTNWWGPNRACVEAMLRDVGFARVECRPHPSAPRGIFHAFK